MQTVLLDEIGRGVEWAQDRLADHEPAGEYVWILDDDDLCIHDPLVAELKAIADQERPEIIMLRMDHGPVKVQPDNDHWRQKPELGHAGVSSIVTRADVWQEHRSAWRPGYYDSDYRFIADVWSARPTVHWHDVVASRVQRISNGGPE